MHTNVILTNKRCTHAQSNYTNTELKALFRRLLCHPAKKRSGPILHPRPTWGVTEINLNRIDIVRNDDELGFLLLHEARDGVHTGPDNRWALRRSVHLALHTFLRTTSQACCLLLPRLRPVFIHQTEQLCSYSNIQNHTTFHSYQG